MRPPSPEHTNIKRKLIRDIAKAKSLPTPALAKKNMVVASLNPNPLIDIGNMIIAPISGENTK